MTYLSLISPWLGNDKWTIRGYELLLPQKPITKASSIAFYQVDPAIFREMRIQVALALAFVGWALIVCFLLKRKWVYRTAHASRVLCWIIVGLFLNFILYLGMLRYRLDREVLRAVLGMILGNGNVSGPRGFPLIMESPKYGFAIFLSGLLVICIEVASSSGSRGGSSNTSESG